MMRIRQLLAALLVTLVTATAIASPPLPPPVRLPRVVTRVRPPPAAPPPVAPKAPVLAPVAAKPSTPAPPPKIHTRDWSAAPAIAEHVPAGPVYAVSDLHGHYEGAVKLLKGNGLVKGDEAHPESLSWTGQKATLVVVGDFVNKGAGSVKLIDMFRAIQKSAATAGGKVIVTLGNHEADFIQTPSSKRAMRDGSDGRHGVGNELKMRGESAADVAAGIDESGRGAWMRELPFAAKVGDTFFVHAGNTDGKSREDLETHIEKHVTGGGFGHDEIIGEHATVLGADDWKATATHAADNAKKLGVKRIVMGHIPKALEGEGDIARTRDGSLVKIDTGFGNDSAPPKLLEIGDGGKLLSRDEAGKATKVRAFD